jgi:hypothetical protein
VVVEVWPGCSPEEGDIQLMGNPRRVASLLSGLFQAGGVEREWIVVKPDPAPKELFQSVLMVG